MLAFDGVVLGDLAVPCEIFGRARGVDGEPRYEVRVCSELAVVHSEHVALQVPFRLASVSRADTVFVPGIDDLDRAIPPAVLGAVRRAVDRGARVASICSGAFLLAATGALDGMRATTHWLSAAELARRHPRVDVDPRVLYVDNGRVLTSAGAAAGLDLCLHLVRLDLGAEAAANVARAAVMPLERAGGQAQFIVHPPPTQSGSLDPLLVWLDQNVQQDLSIERIARHAGMSPRTLCRRFHAHVGTSVAHWIRGVRVRRAQRLLETTELSIEAIAAEVGFQSTTVLREHFARIVGTSPLAYRRSMTRGAKVD